MCYSLWYNAPTLPATGRQHRGCIIPQSSAPEDGQNHLPKNVELIGIINKLLLLHLIGCLYYWKGDEFAHVWIKSWVMSFTD